MFHVTAFEKKLSAVGLIGLQKFNCIKCRASLAQSRGHRKTKLWRFKTIVRAHLRRFFNSRFKRRQRTTGEFTLRRSIAPRVSSDSPQSATAPDGRYRSQPNSTAQETQAFLGRSNFVNSRRYAKEPPIKMLDKG